MQADRISSSHQVESGKKSIEPEHMITMQMTDEDVVYFAESDTASSELHLCSFTTVYQKHPLMYSEHMSGWVSSRCR